MWQWHHPFFYFTDPLLRAPTLACMFMGLGASLVGVLAYLRQQSLVGEALSHASYPGVILGAFFLASFMPDSIDKYLEVSVLIGAFTFSLLGLCFIRFLQVFARVHHDAALCAVLSSFFGIGITFASQVQFAYPQVYKKMQLYLYGQAVTMLDQHVWMFFFLAFFICLVCYLFYKELQLIFFDKLFAKFVGRWVFLIESIILFLLVLVIVLGIRAMGVVLMTAMLIAPAIAARQLTSSLYTMFILSAFFGVLSGFLGNYLSCELSYFFSEKTAGSFILPTGPMIVLVAAGFSFLTLLFSPLRGIIPRGYRIRSFHYRCAKENILKAAWRSFSKDKEGITYVKLGEILRLNKYYLKFLLWRLKARGYLHLSQGRLYLTAKGEKKALNIVRLHRLWELYLVKKLGVGEHEVHRSAEEMEHIITPDLEKELSSLLDDPKWDPHQQPIPEREELTTCKHPI